MRGVRGGPEVVGVGHRGVPVAELEQPVQHAGGDQRGVEVAVSRRAPLQARDRPATPPGSGRRRAAWAPGSAGSRGRDRRRPGRRSGASAARVSSRVRKLFMKISGSLTPYAARAARTCSTMRSRNVRPSRTGSSDLAWSIPIEVPRPPLSLIITGGRERRRGLLVVHRARRSAGRDRSSGLDAVLGDEAGDPLLQLAVVGGEHVDRRLR